MKTDCWVDLLKYLRVKSKANQRRKKVSSQCLLVRARLSFLFYRKKTSESTAKVNVWPEKSKRAEK